MSKLEQLINELCPEGVEYKALGELGAFYSGLSGKSKDDFSNGNAKFITYINVFSNLSLKIDVDDKVKIGENENQYNMGIFCLQVLRKLPKNVVCHRF